MRRRQLKIKGYLLNQSKQLYKSKNISRDVHSLRICFKIFEKHPIGPSILYLRNSMMLDIHHLWINAFRCPHLNKFIRLGEDDESTPGNILPSNFTTLGNRMRR